jgi:protein-disulfide isomerase
MHDLLLEHQEALEDDDLSLYAVGLQLDRLEFRTDLAEEIHAPRVRADFLGGVRSGVNGTPTFFINGVRHDGPFDLVTLLDVIEGALGGDGSVLGRRR